ncbi:MAG TPA: response regulator [Nitrososphaeraceae archaeon]|jgi:DNA-binding NtrC family response regulator|nr:response regulator [Nitrososphaeraceae archaeon]
MLAKIALIDDDHDIITLFSEILELNGYTIATFTDPIDAFTNLQANIEDYDLIISDFKMPCLSGNSLCQKLLTINPELKVIIISAYSDIEYDRKFTFVSKPLSMPKLLQIVGEKLKEQKKPQVSIV